eukprot:jgi/Botrbrau1/3112/Bobra.0070s0089.2
MVKHHYNVEEIARHLSDDVLQQIHSRSFDFSSFVMGIFIVVTLLTAVAFIARNGWSRRDRRRRLAHVLQKLSALDAEGAQKLFGDVGLPSWLSYEEEEHVKWANAFFGQMWTAKLGGVMSKMAADQITPVLQESKPAWMGAINLVKFDLGEIPPTITAVQVSRTPRTDRHGRPVEIIMEMNFEWKGDQEMELIVKPLPRKLGPATFVLQGLSTFVKLRVGLEDLFVRGRVRVTARPLLETLPCISAIQVSFVGMPKYSFDLRVYGGNVRMLPGVQAYLNQLVRDSLRPYTLPEKIIIPVMEQGENDVLDPPAGIITVKVIEARHLPKKDLLGLCDPYVRVSLSEHMQQKTEVKKHTLNPKWQDEEMTLLVYEPELQTLNAVVYDWDRFTASESFCKCEVPISSLPHGEMQDLWLDLHDPDDADVPVRHPVPGVAAGKKIVDATTTL